jgi:M6 family metalloprotease-like protein
MEHRILSKILVALFLLLFLAPYVSGSTGHKSAVTPSTTPSLTLPLPAPPVVGSTTELAPVSGVLRVLVIAAQFSDINASVSISQLKQQWSGQVNQYYQQVSYGTVSLQVDVFGWYKLPYPETYYGKDCLGIDDSDCTGADGSWKVASDAVVAAQHDVSFSNYDYFVFVHSGYGQESTGVKQDVWSVTYLGGIWVQTNGKSLNKFSVDPELEAGGASPIGVYAHEFGHQLGLPDLYNTQTGRSIMGPWTLMDAGLWNGNPPGSSPAHLDSWCKIQLGWISGPMLAVANSAAASDYTIDPTESSSNNIHGIQVPVSNTQASSKYYLIEVRQRIGFDSALPTVGVLILYVDETALVGRVKVVDANPDVSGLKAAAWNVGQTFNDGTNNIAIKVVSQVGNSYQVRVSRSGIIQPPTQNYVQLSITKIFAQPNVVTLPNTTVTIYVDISNQGNQSVNNVLVEVDLDGQQYTTTYVSVGVGLTTETSFTWASVAGSHTFKVIVDPFNTLNETDRADNEATFTVNVGPTLTIDVPVNVTSNGASVWIKINGVQYNLTSTRLQVSVPNGTVVIQIESAVNTSLGSREAFSQWSDGNNANPRQILITSDTQVAALFRTQYLLTVDQDMGTTSPGGWYDKSSIAVVTADATSNEIPNTTRLLFMNWTGDYNSTSTSVSINMTKPVAIRANWVRQYYVTILSPTGSPSGAGWYNAGSTADVTVQPIVQFSNSTRAVFTGWNTTFLGNAPGFQFKVTSPARLQALWKIQYLVQVVSPYGNPQGSGWHDEGSTVQVSIQPQVDFSNRTRRNFEGWTGDFSGTSTSLTVTVNRPMNLSAQWTTQYEVTFKISGLPNSTYVTLNVNNASERIAANQPHSAWYDQGQTLDPNTNQTVMRFFRFANWRNSTGFKVENPMTVNGPEDYTAVYAPSFALGIPGFPIESILLGIAAGLLMLTVTRGHRRNKRRRQESLE